MKAEIRRIGTVVRDQDGTAIGISGWDFAPADGAVALDEGFFFGWTIEELAELARLEEVYRATV